MSGEEDGEPQSETETSESPPEVTRAGTLDTSDEEQDKEERFARYVEISTHFIQAVELVAAGVFAILFAIGVVDLALQIIQAVRSGTITDPLVVVGFIDTGLLLLIIVEVYNTVIAYTQEENMERIVRMVIYTGVIAMVRKAIIFRTGEYATTMDALFASISYAILIVGLVALLFVERMYTSEYATD